MSKIGLIYCAFNTEGYLPDSLFPWLQARRGHLGGHEFLIAVVSVPFEGFQNDGIDGTQSALRVYERDKDIDWLLAGQTPMKEIEARGAALKWLTSQGVDILWQADSDEFPTTDEIATTLKFVESRPHTVWFKGSLKNYVWNDKTYLLDPFTPARIHRLAAPGGYLANGFWADNNVIYKRPFSEEEATDTSFSHLTIPKSVQWIKHLTWMNTDRSRRKIEYQTLARQWPSCSFAWDDSKGGLIWNESHFARTGESIPELGHD